MKQAIWFVLILNALFLTGCKLGGEAVGLSEPLTLIEENSEATVLVERDGEFEFAEDFPLRSHYRVMVKDSGNMDCRVRNGEGVIGGHVDSILVDCSGLSCTLQYEPVCAKGQGNIVCVTEPCYNYTYSTYGNYCTASVVGALVAFDGECLGLEDVATTSDQPANMYDFSKGVPTSEPADIISATFNNELLTLDIEHSGGCGTHEFKLLLSDAFMESFPVQVQAALIHKSDDPCDGIMRSQRQFDLAPLQEFYRRAYGDESGTVIIQGIGAFDF